MEPECIPGLCPAGSIHDPVTIENDFIDKNGILRQFAEKKFKSKLYPTNDVKTSRTAVFEDFTGKLLDLKVKYRERCVKKTEKNKC